MNTNFARNTAGEWRSSFCAILTVIVVGTIYDAIQTLTRLEALERGRDQWQRPSDVIQELNLEDGSIVGTNLYAGTINQSDLLFAPLCCASRLASMRRSDGDLNRNDECLSAFYSHRCDHSGVIRTLYD
jgi:hypothetical protein